MKKRTIFLIVILIVIGLALIKIFVIPGSKSSGPAKSNPMSAALNVTVILAKFDTLENEIFIAGTLSSNESVDLQPETQGKIIGIYFQEGHRVNKGDLLVKLNDAELQATLKKIAAQLKLASEKEIRLKKLLELNGVSKEEYEIALNQFQSLQADEQIMKAKIALTEIKAPFSGIVGLKYVSVGSIVNSASKIATLEQNDQVKLDISVPEKYTSLIKVGDLINFKTDGNLNTFTAKVYAADPKIEEETRSLKLRAICANYSGQLKAGSFAKVVLNLNKRTNAIMVPTQALVPDMKGQKLFICKNGMSQPQVVKTGIRTSDRIEITDGIKLGDSIIVLGVLQAKPGQKVNVIKSN